MEKQVKLIAEKLKLPNKAVRSVIDKFFGPKDNPDILDVIIKKLDTYVDEPFNVNEANKRLDELQEQLADWFQSTLPPIEEEKSLVDEPEETKEEIIRKMEQEIQEEREKLPLPEESPATIAESQGVMRQEGTNVFTERNLAIAGGATIAGLIATPLIVGIGGYVYHRLFDKKENALEGKKKD